jgi:hypothetical protein
MIIVLATLAFPAFLVQDPAPAGSAPPPQTKSAESLRQQIHGMRRTILMGGDSVRNSEKEAVQFLAIKIEGIDKRLDFIQGDLVQKRTSYELVLNRAGEASTTKAQNAALAEAAQIQTELQELENESVLLSKRRKSLVVEQSRIEGRRRDREGLAAKMDSQGLDAEYTPFLSGGVGLGPETGKPVNPLMANPALREDFLRRFPVRGRQLLFEADPVEYWNRWPLNPPAMLIASTLAFPPPDLPGRR